MTAIKLVPSLDTWAATQLEPALGLVPTYETALLLRQAGFPQGAQFSWYIYPDSPSVARLAISRRLGEGASGDRVAAPTLAEVLEQLPALIKWDVETAFGREEHEADLSIYPGKPWVMIYTPDVRGAMAERPHGKHNNAAEAAARLYLALATAGHLPQTQTEDAR